MVTSLAHAAFGSRDMTATLDYYCRGLGFTHAFSIPDDSGRPWIEYVKVADGQFLEFFYMKDGDTPDRVFRHICFAVDDAEKTCAELISRGIKITRPPSVGKDKNVQFWSADPDGTAVEFMQLSPESPQANS